MYNIGHFLFDSVAFVLFRKYAKLPTFDEIFVSTLYKCPTYHTESCTICSTKSVRNYDCECHDHQNIFHNNHPDIIKNTSNWYV